ncbi:hypothetical protein MCOR07_003534 [Pyricularia oryzae]|uniref:Uncharacterized protein n=2 Tax=Pyricularia TaxID=48558 RepID=A0ABQ8NMC3_PYRGI|nr:hypothetical protein MCOR26_007042 [Pyricularia oryzae]KAI6299335.1 hypothetical protein MCOR33_004751 [Pyricularia grisea]KAI6318829.1 hypothetical protein MCOR29_005816 [Pyricularia oryzae]KAI6425775.1 hypothetical protein MCOR24_003007 [Pyricularia oryzae]KAI6624218.1 hypothetical protein MCOR07_003534 [Pyricularia oryzae]
MLGTSTGIMETSHQPTTPAADRSTERPWQIRETEDIDHDVRQPISEIPRIREHLATEIETGANPQAEGTNSTTLLHTMFHLLDSIEMWLEVAAQQKHPGFEGGRQRSDRRATLPASMTLQVPPGPAPGATHPPFSPTRTVFSAAASSIQGNRPRPSEYERSMVDLRRSFGLAASRSDLIDDGMPWSGLGINRQHTPTLPRVSEDVDQEPSVAPKVRRRRTMGAMPEERPEPLKMRPSAQEPGQAHVPIVVKVSSRPPNPRRASASVRPKPVRKEGSARTSPSRSNKESRSRRPPSVTSMQSIRAEYAELVSLIVHNWRQSLLLKLETAKERYRVRAEVPPPVHPEAERQRRRLAEKPLPSLPSSPTSSTSEAKPAPAPKRKTRPPIRRRPQSAYV